METFMKFENNGCDDFEMSPEEILAEQRALMGLDDSDEESLYTPEDQAIVNRDEYEHHSNKELSPVTPNDSKKHPEKLDQNPNSPPSVLHIGNIIMCGSMEGSNETHKTHEQGKWERGESPNYFTETKTNAVVTRNGGNMASTDVEVVKLDDGTTNLFLKSSSKSTPDSSVMADNGVDDLDLKTTIFPSLNTIWTSSFDSINGEDVTESGNFVNVPHHKDVKSPSRPGTEQEDNDLDSVEEYLEQRVERTVVEREDTNDLLEQLHDLMDDGEHSCDEDEGLDDYDGSRKHNEAVENEILRANQNTKDLEAKLQQSMRRIKEMEYIGARVKFELDYHDDDLSNGEMDGESANTDVKEDYLNRISDSAAKLEELEAQNSRASKEVAELRSQLWQTQALVDDLEHEKSYNGAKVAELQELLQIESEEEAFKHLAVKATQIAALTAEIVQLKKVLSDCDTQLETLQQERDANRNMVVELSDVFRMAEETHDTEKDEYAQLLKEGEVLTRDQALELTVQGLRKKVEVMAEEKADFQATILSLQEAIVTLNLENESRAAKIEALESQFLLINQRQDDTEGPEDPKRSSRFRDWGFPMRLGLGDATKKQTREEEESEEDRELDKAQPGSGDDVSISILDGTSQ